MPAKQQQGKKSGGSRKISRNKEKCKAYQLSHHREFNKAKRVLKSQGIGACESYISSHVLTAQQVRALQHKITGLKA